MTTDSTHHKTGTTEEAAEVPFGANAVRLSPRLCIVAAVLLLLLAVSVPMLWNVLEPLKTGPDYRIPYALSEDYWLYDRYVDQAMAEDARIPIIGDSVVWGQYVLPEGTLSHALNAGLGDTRFANLGVNGSHPVALSGLIKHYGGGIRGRKVVLHYNPLWMSSKRRDLQTAKPTRFNHPDLVPQFFPAIPSYEESIAHRLSVAIGHRLHYLGWIAHIQKAYFGNESLPAWTMERPYTNPLGAVSMALPQPAPRAPSDPVPWTSKEIRPQAFAWMGLEESLQWRFFKTSLARLQARGNEVFVLVGPLNEHMLTEENRAVYQGIRDDILAWLETEDVASFAAEVLPTALYADTSHPLDAGYTLWAEQLLADEGFRVFLAD